MFLRNFQVNYCINGQIVLNQSGEVDIKTIEANKLFLEEMFSIFHQGTEIEVVAKSI